MHITNIEKTFWAPVSFKEYQTCLHAAVTWLFLSSPDFCLIDKCQVFGAEAKLQKHTSLPISGSNTYILSQPR